MPSWIETKAEIKNKNNDYDRVRSERIKAIEAITHRPLMIYATDFLNREKVQLCGGEVSIDGNDKVGFCEVIEKIEGENLDILIHSPGGDPGAAESLIEILRTRFKSIRFIIPDQAKSAATMMCCASDEVLMDERSELGPIDPQLVITRPDGRIITAPGQAIIDQFDKAKEAIAKDPRSLPAWLPILQSYAPSLLSVCESADKLSQDLVTKWLQKYMLGDEKDPNGHALQLATFLADSKNHLSHGRRIGIDDLVAQGFKVLDLRTVPELRDRIWDLYLSIRVTFEDTGVFKLIENGMNVRYARIVQLVVPTMPQQKGLPIPEQQDQQIRAARKRHK